VEKKQLRLAVLVLAITNVLTIVFFLLMPDASRETVATVGNDKITRQEWLNELEARYGEDTLRDLVDKKVIETVASDYDIKIADSDLEQELTMYKALYGTQGQLSGEEWEEQVKLSLLLEELLTKDATFPEEDLEEYYYQNRDFYDIQASYQLSQIIVKSLAEAEQTVKELEGGSSFAALAMERSRDEFSANYGGDIGFVSENDETVEQIILTTAQDMKPGTWSDPIPLDSGYAIIFLHEKLKGQTYSFEDVKEQIRRQMAIEQMEIPVSAQAFWDEAEVSWFYGNEEEKE